MAWPAEAGALFQIKSHGVLSPEVGTAEFINPAPWRTKFYQQARGTFRIFNAAAYRFYGGTSTIPKETDTPYDTASSLPDTPTDTYSTDGTRYFAVSYFDGVLDSGFLAVGPNGERYWRLDISSDVEVDSPPQKPNDVRLELKANGVVRVLGLYAYTGDERADTWALTYTVNGSDPGSGSPDYTEDMATSGLCVFDYDLPAQANGTTVKVRLQTRRSGSYSETDSDDIRTATADATGPSAPPGGSQWTGTIDG